MQAIFIYQISEDTIQLFSNFFLCSVFGRYSFVFFQFFALKRRRLIIVFQCTKFPRKLSTFLRFFFAKLFEILFHQHIASFVYKFFRGHYSIVCIESVRIRNSGRCKSIIKVVCIRMFWLCFFFFKTAWHRRNVSFQPLFENAFSLNYFFSLKYYILAPLIQGKKII